MRLLSVRIADIRGAAAAAAHVEKKAYGWFENGEERYLELQKWKRCASP